VTYTYYSDPKCEKRVSAHKNAGVYYVKASVAADASYKAATSKAVKLTIKKASNPMTVFPNALTYRKDALTRTNYFAIKVESAKGKVTYRASSKAKKAGISVTKAGLVTIPKNCRKGTYKIRVYADGTQNYKAMCYYVTVTVK
jgi:flagellar hook assembly protein FlgD